MADPIVTAAKNDVSKVEATVKTDASKLVNTVETDVKTDLAKTVSVKVLVIAVVAALIVGAILAKVL
jgi:hypothetical protein